CAVIGSKGSPVQLNWKLKKLAAAPPATGECSRDSVLLPAELPKAFDEQSQVHVLDYDTPNGSVRLRSRAVVLTAPSYVTAELLRPVCAPAAETLSAIRYPRVAAVTVEYPRSAFREPAHGKGIVNGFGQLHPRTQGIRTLGTIYSSSLFPNRMPDDDKIMLLHYIGGARDPELFGGIQDGKYCPRLEIGLGENSLASQVITVLTYVGGENVVK
ncbi:PPXI, partial [Symbiodinium natans]